MHAVLRCCLSLKMQVQNRWLTRSLSSRFKIKDDEIGRDPLAAWACIRLNRLRTGYRLVHLHDCAGEKTGGVLLVKIVKEYV